MDTKNPETNTTELEPTLDTPNTLQTPQPTHNYKLIKLIFGLTGLMFLGVAGYFFAYANPTKVWQLMLKGHEKTSYLNHTIFTYKDNGEINDTSLLLGMALKDFTVKLDIDSYIDETAKEFIDSSNKITYTFSSGNSSFASGVESRIKNNILYINIGNNPFLTRFIDEEKGINKPDWIKINIKDLDELAKNKDYTNEEFANFYKEISSQEFRVRLEQIWTDGNVIRVGKSLGSENINGKKTYHFENTADKEALRNVLSLYIDELVKVFNHTKEEVKPNETDAIKNAVAQILQRMEIKSFETWVGAGNARIYKVVITASMPSFTSLINNIGGKNTPLARDEARLRGTDTYTEALRRYAVDYQGYPENLEELLVKNGSSNDSEDQYTGSHPYLYLKPETPEKADGSCADKYKGWVYLPVNKTKNSSGVTVYSNYKIYTCLGGTTEIYTYYQQNSNTVRHVGNGKSVFAAGMLIADPEGIYNGNCPETDESCYKNGKLIETGESAQDRRIRETIENLDFNAELTFESEFKDYGKKQEIQIPTNDSDIIEKIKNSRALNQNAQ